MNTNNLPPELYEIPETIYYVHLPSGGHARVDVDLGCHTAKGYEWLEACGFVKCSAFTYWLTRLGMKRLSAYSHENPILAESLAAVACIGGVVYITLAWWRAI